MQARVAAIESKELPQRHRLVGWLVGRWVNLRNPIKCWQLNILLVILHLVSPSPSPQYFRAKHPCNFVIFYHLLLPLSLLLQSVTAPPSPAPIVTVQFIPPMCFSPLLFHNNIL